MELEEAIKILNDLKENVALFSTGWYPILKEGERQAIETVLNYIKEESIPRALVEEVINKQIEIIRNENEQLYYAENVTDVILEDILQEILTKGE